MSEDIHLASAEAGVIVSKLCMTTVTSDKLSANTAPNPLPKSLKHVSYSRSSIYIPFAP
jgi:hypothetical protein